MLFTSTINAPDDNSQHVIDTINRDLITMQTHELLLRTDVKSIVKFVLNHELYDDSINMRLVLQRMIPFRWQLKHLHKHS